MRCTLWAIWLLVPDPFFKANEIGEERRIAAAAIFRQRRFGKDRRTIVCTVHAPAESAGFPAFSRGTAQNQPVFGQTGSSPSKNRGTNALSEMD